MILSTSGKALPARLGLSMPMRPVRRTICVRVKAFVEDEITRAPTKVSVSVSVPLRVRFGEHLRLVGSDESLGSWNVENAPELSCSDDGNTWSAMLDLPTSQMIEYKLVHIIPGQEPVWEFTHNRVLKVPSDPIALNLPWCQSENIAPLEEVVPLEQGVTEASEPEVLATAQVAVEESKVNTLTGDGGDALAESQMQSVMFEENTGIASEEMASEDKPINIDPSMDAPAAALNAESIEIPSTEEIDASVQKDSGSSMFKQATKTAGYVALGVAGAAMLSALAVDVTDAAILGAVAAAAGGAAMSNGSKGSKKSSKKADGSEEEGSEFGSDAMEERKITGAGEAGVVIAAGLLSALDAGKSLLAKEGDNTTNGAKEEETEEE